MYKAYTKAILLFTVLKDFQRVLDDPDIYVYDNWADGELAYGP